MDVVEFTGYCTYQNVEVKALVQFTLSKERDTFEATYLSLIEQKRGGFMGETEQQSKECEHQEDLQRLRGLRPTDDDFMRCLFKDNIPLAELVLRIITGKPDLVITDCQTQKDMKRLAGARTVSNYADDMMI